jgi:MFS family permease
MEETMNQGVEAPVEKTPHPFTVLNFRLLWMGEAISLLGDQFSMIALPWLVLQLTGSALALGTVMALGGIPRALFMLIGGALVDRFSPRYVMMASNFGRFVLVVLLSAMVLTDNISLGMLYVFALAFGLADSFYFPAQTAIIPQLLPEEQLQYGNIIVQGTAQISYFLGPVLAGGLIALLGHAATTGSAPSMQGIGIAFGLDALTFVASLLCLALMRVAAMTKQDDKQQTVIESIKEGFAYLWSQAVLRVFFMLVIAINFLILGPVSVGIPVLAATRLAEGTAGAAAYGIIMSAFGGGALLGTILSSALSLLKHKHFASIMLLIISVMGFGVALMPFFGSTAVVAVIMLVIGIANGYVNIHFFTWLQKRIPQELMGRVMSLLIFSSIGLSPVSNALAGAILEINLNLLFIGGGLTMAAVSLLSILLPAVRKAGAEAASISKAA